MRVCLLAWLLLLGGCWNWSFPSELLKEDSSPPEAQVDVKSDTAQDTEPPDGPPRDSVVDGQPDLAFDTTLQCTPACSPTSTTPICDNGTCRGCQTHGECQGTGGLCAADGSCPAASSIAYVDKMNGGCSATGGTKGTPYCTIKEALATTKKHVLVRKGSYTDDVTFSGVREFYGEPGAIIDLADCEKLTVKGNSTNVRLQGFTIQSDPTQKDTSKAMILLSEAAKLTLSQNQIGPSGCIGIKSGANNTVTLQRNLVLKNPGGGMDLDGTYQVENNIIIQNSEATVSFGGARLDPADITKSAFINNTVADNVSKSTKSDEVGGVRCEVDNTKLENNIFWGNTFNTTGDSTKDRQYSTKCDADFSFEELNTGATPTKNNITAAVAGFVGTAPRPATADAYHIKPSSDAVDKGTPTGAPAVDYDGQTRDKNPDIGADELDP